MTYGVDGLSVAMVKRVKNEIAEQLSIVLINRSIEFEYCP